MKCQICQHSDNNELYQVKEMFYGLDESFNYFKCANCGCLQIETVPQDIQKYYPQDYYSYQSRNKPNNSIKRILIKFRDEFATLNKNYVGKILYKFFPNPSIRSLGVIQLNLESRILDVGCGSGKLLLSLKDIGFNNILGIDPFNTKDIQYENGLKIEKKSIFNIKNNYDLIMFHHSFEHMENPIKTLKHVYSLLNAHGTCLIRIPIVSSYSWEHYKTNWVNLDAPRHFFLHSIKSMELLAKEANFKIESIQYDSTAFQFWGSEQYKKNIPLTSTESIFTKKQIRGFEKKAQKLNNEKLGDQAVFYLKK